jgi:hypothetical protein
MSRLIRAAVLALALCAVPSPAMAQAADTVINFDDQPAHTEIEDQYSAEGITFNETPSGLTVPKSTVVAPTGGEAHSPPNVLDVSQKCGSEFPEVQLWGRFAAPREHVSLFVGNLNLGSGYPGTISLEGFDLGGNPIPSAKDQVTFSGLGLNTEMGIQSSNSEISFFKLASNALCTVGIDDLSFDSLPETIPPDFGLSAQGQAPTLNAGGSTTVTLRLNRTSTSVGPISFGVSGEPIGVSASVSPNPSSGPNGSSLDLTLSAAPNAQPATEVPVTVSGTPSPAAGEHQRSVTIPVSVVGNYDLRAQGLEVTQGIQGEGPLTPSPRLGGKSVGDYNGLDLVAHKQTAVRFFADAHGAIGSGISQVGALLYGYRNGQLLPGSPLHPQFGPAKLVSVQEADPAPVLEPERKSQTNAYTFTLPGSWSWGTDKLVARIYKEPSFPGPKQAPECPSTKCQTDNGFTLRGVSFHPTENVMLWTAALTANGKLPVPSSVALRDAQFVAPLPTSGYSWREPNAGFTVLPYQGTIDITDIVNSSSENKAVEAANRVDQMASAIGHPGFAAMGIAPEGIGGVTIGLRGATMALNYDPAKVNRPLTGVSHELFHSFGLLHASRECGGGTNGQQGAPWPLKSGESHSGFAASIGVDPNAGSSEEGFGQLLGIGLNMGADPYAVRADGANGIANYFDLMSYCSPAGGGDPAAWVSPINWEAVFQSFALNSAGGSSLAGTSAHHRRHSSATLNRKRLRVFAYEDDSGFQLASVGPQVGPRLPKGTSSFTLQALGKDGQILASTQMAASAGHQDNTTRLVELSGEVPAAGVEGIAVVQNGITLATRARPGRPPRVRVVAPRRGSRVGGRHKVRVRWRTKGPGLGTLTAAIDYSHDNGRSWQTVYVGPDKGRAALPAFSFSGSPSARVRVRVNDGFNEAAAVSARFVARAAPPRVSITPTLSQIAGDATLPLHGQAFDQTAHALGGRRLRWFDGPFPLGSGAEINAGALPPGKNHIRLLATDANGNTGSAHLTVRVRRVELPFLKLAIPRSLPRRARRLVLKVRSAVRAKLAIGKRSFKLKAGHKAKLGVPVRPGASLLLHLSVTTNAARTPFAAVVKRR